MESKLKKIILIIILILLIGLILLNYKTKQYNKTISYLNTDISITIYSRKNVNKNLNEIEQIYKKYNKITDRNKKYDNINNLYYIYYNTSKEQEIAIDKDLYEMIKFGIKWYKKSNGLIDISKGNITDIWQMYIDSKSGYPSDLELKRADTNKIDDIVLLKNNKIKNNHVSINLDFIRESYITDKVIKYLKKEEINNYKIVINNNIYLGSYYKRNDKYDIAIPNLITDKYILLKGENIAINTRNQKNNSYEYNNKIYNDLINPKTLKQSYNMKGITIITKDIEDSDALSLMLYLSNLDESIKYVKKNNIEAIWYSNDGKFIKSDKINKYLKKNNL